MTTTVYFGSEIKTALLSAFQKAQKELHIAVFTFNNPDLLGALRDCCARGVKINLLVNRHEDSKNNLDYSELLKDYDTDIFDLYQVPSSERTMHHKFCIIDREHFFTSSADWTNAALNNNDENALHISDAADLCSQYIAKFEHICQNKTYKQQYASLSPALSIQPAPVAAVVDENLWRKAVSKYYSFQNPSNGYINVAKQGEETVLWGAIDMYGREVVPCEYNWLHNFNAEGLAVCATNNKWGVIDTRGNVVVEPIYEYIVGFFEGLACVRLNNKYGFLNTKGQTVIDYKFGEWGNFQKSKKDPTQIFAVVGWYVDKTRSFIINSKGEQVSKTYSREECLRRIDTLNFED